MAALSLLKALEDSSPLGRDRILELLEVPEARDAAQNLQRTLSAGSFLARTVHFPLNAVRGLPVPGLAVTTSCVKVSADWMDKSAASLRELLSSSRKGRPTFLTSPMPRRSLSMSVIEAYNLSSQAVLQPQTLLPLESCCWDTTQLSPADHRSPAAATAAATHAAAADANAGPSPGSKLARITERASKERGSEVSNGSARHSRAEEETGIRLSTTPSPTSSPCEQEASTSADQPQPLPQLLRGLDSHWSPATLQDGPSLPSEAEEGSEEEDTATQVADSPDGMAQPGTLLERPRGRRVHPAGGPSPTHGGGPKKPLLRRLANAPKALWASRKKAAK